MENNTQQQHTDGPTPQDDAHAKAAAAPWTPKTEGEWVAVLVSMGEESRLVEQKHQKQLAFQTARVAALQDQLYEVVSAQNEFLKKLFLAQKPEGPKGE